MPSLQQSESSDKAEKITFRCSLELKRAIRVGAAKRDLSIEEFCVYLISRDLGLPAATSESAHEQAETSGGGSRKQKAPAA